MDLKPSHVLPQFIHTHRLRKNCPPISHSFLKPRNSFQNTFSLLLFLDSTLKYHCTRILGISLLAQLFCILPSTWRCSENVWKSNYSSLPLCLFGCLLSLYLHDRCWKLKSKILKERKSNVSCFLSTCKSVPLSVSVSVSVAPDVAVA